MQTPTTNKEIDVNSTGCGLGNNDTYCTKLFTKRQNFRLVKIGSICRQQNESDKKMKFALGRVENIVGKGENAGY